MANCPQINLQYRSSSIPITILLFLPRITIIAQIYYLNIIHLMIIMKKMKRERKERKKNRKEVLLLRFFILYRYLISITLVLPRLRYIFHQSLHLSINYQHCLLFIMICLLVTLEQHNQSSFVSWLYSNQSINLMVAPYDRQQISYIDLVH